MNGCRALVAREMKEKIIGEPVTKSQDPVIVPNCIPALHALGIISVRVIHIRFLEVSEWTLGQQTFEYAFVITKGRHHYINDLSMAMW